MSDGNPEGGFITLHHAIRKSWLWKMPAAQTKVALTLLLMANWKEGKTFSGGEVVTIQRGQCMTSLDSIANEAGESLRTVRTALFNLGRAKFLTSRATNRYRIITILNYNKYQDKRDGDRQAKRQASDKPATSDRQASDNDRTREQGNKKNKGTSKAHQLPDSWQPNTKHEEKAMLDSTDILEAVESFRDFHQAKGSTMKSWDAAFNTWLRNAKKFADKDLARQPSQPQEKML